MFCNAGFNWSIINILVQKCSHNYLLHEHIELTLHTGKL
jgi:hypothetical protein